MSRDPNAMSIPEIRGEIAEIRAKSKRVIQEMGPNHNPALITSLEGDTHSKMTQFRAMNDRAEALSMAMDAKEGAGRWARIWAISEQPERDNPFLPSEPGYGDAEERLPAKSLGRRVIESGGWKADGNAVVPFSAAELKATMTTSAGWEPESQRSGRVVMSPQRGLSVIDLLPIVSTDSAVYKFMRETTFTNNAAEKAETVQFGEGTLGLDEIDVPLRKIPTYLAVSDEQLADERGAIAFINNRLSYMVRNRLDSQLLVGDGIAPNIEGFFTNSDVGTETMTSSEPVFDALARAVTQVQETGRAEPDAWVINPTVWQNIRLQRNVDGKYILGDPAARDERVLYGLPVVVSSAVPANKALLGAFQQMSALVQRTGVEIKISDSHDDFFVKGIQAVRATLRAALAIYRPEAFVVIDGLGNAA